MHETKRGGSFLILYFISLLFYIITIFYHLLRQIERGNPFSFHFAHAMFPSLSRRSSVRVVFSKNMRCRKLCQTAVHSSIVNNCILCRIIGARPHFVSNGVTNTLSMRKALRHVTAFFCKGYSGCRVHARDGFIRIFIFFAIGCIFMRMLQVIHRLFIRILPAK